MIQVSFHGAMEEVGRSAFLVDTGIEKIVLDYGTKLRETPPLFPMPIKTKPDCILLSHCHLDHSGGVPIFSANGDSVPIFAIDPTRSLTELLLYDSVKISHEEGIHLPFDDEDVMNTIKAFVPTKYRKPFKLKKSEVTYFDAGHIPGSAMIHLNFGKKSLLYTGDFNTVDTRLLKKADTNLPDVNYLVTESTYAQREHPPREGVEKELVELIEETISKDGICLITGFAIQRLQEILVSMSKRGIDYPVYLDGMAKKATTIINKHKELLREPNALDKALEKVQYVNSEKQRKKIIKNPCAILTTSGMLTGGAVVWYLKKLHDQQNSSLFLTGFQLEDTPGKNLLETGMFIHKNISLEVNMFVKRFDFSGHVGRTGLFDFIKKINPEKVFCIHGDHTEEFAQELRDKGYNAVAPVANNRTFDLH